MATPEHPNTTHIKALVSAGDVDGINALTDNHDIALPYLVMAASHLTGDSTKIGAMLRSQSDKRSRPTHEVHFVRARENPAHPYARVCRASCQRLRRDLTYD